MMRKILFLESRYDSFYGAQKSMLKLIQSLDNDKFSYKVVTTDEGNFKKGFEENNVKVDVLKLGEKANVFGGRIFDYNILEKILVIFQIIIYNIKIYFYIKKNKIDIVYVNDLRAFLYSALATKLLRKKSVWYVRSEISDSILNRLGFWFCNHIITIARGVLKNIPKRTIQKYDNKIKNIYTGFDFSQFQIIDKKVSKRSYDLSENRYVIGYLGSINERKGIDFLVDTFIELCKRRSDLELFIVGDVSHGFEEYWNSQIKKLEKANVRFKYNGYKKEISKAYCAMDVFVLPSRSEGLPRVVIEAMAHQLPVIATDVGGTKEIIKSKSRGIVINKDDNIGLIQAIEVLLNNEDYRYDSGKAGKKYVESAFNAEKFKFEINNFFKSI